ncbi:GntR family transcriptional regulator [Corynebacterium suranareeae]|nr:GntR family transcriptional regulator [Corynebacterium suranareeae]
MKPAPRATSQRRAYDYLCTKVLVDPSRQGQFLNEQELAEEIGVSRTPIREALRTLASEGLVEQIANRGTFVPVITKKQILDVMELRDLLEHHAASMSISKGKPPIDQMRATLRQQEEILKDPQATDSIEFIRLDREFHFHLLKACDNDEIIQTYDRLRVRQRAMGVQALYAVSRWREVCEEHEQIVNALESGDLEQVNRTISKHLEMTTAVLLADLPN